MGAYQYSGFFLFIIFCCAQSPEEANCLIEFQYPSYIDRNHYGLCLRATDELKRGTIVAQAVFEQTDKPYIAHHASREYRHVAIMGITETGTPLYGRMRGKWAFCNHSCDPNCMLNEDLYIITNRSVRRGEELTIAYDAFIPTIAWQKAWNFNCLCGAPTCKKFINGYRMDIISPIVKKNINEKRSYEKIN